MVTVTETASTKATRGTKQTRKRLLTVGTGTFKVGGGISREVSITLNRIGTKLLASRHKLTALLKLRQGHITLSRTVTLRVQASAKRRRNA